MPNFKVDSIFDHINNLTVLKKSWRKLNRESRKSFSPYMTNRLISMDYDMISIVDDIQQYTAGQLKPKDIYNMYLDLLPNKKMWNKYIKSQKKEPNKELVKYLEEYYQVSPREVKMYLAILKSDDIENILRGFGLNKAAVKKIMK